MMTEKITPAHNVGVSTIAAGLGQTACAMIVSSNPEMLPFAAVCGTAITGFLGGLGNFARSKGGAWKLLGFLG